MGRLIDADALMKTLGINDMDCDKCKWKDAYGCSRGSAFEDACVAIEDAPTAQQWIPCNNCERKCDKWENTKI